MMRKLPQLNALKAFEAAARHESFTKAAGELSVTQGAISQQVKLLEAELQLKLFLRQHQKLVLTGLGRKYMAIVGEAFDLIATGTEELRQRQSSGVLTVSTSPDFAAKWLVHRLDLFAEACPDIDLRVSATMHHVDFSTEDVDIAIRHGTGQWPSLHVERLCAEKLFFVCSPKLLAGKNAIRKPADIVKHPLLHFESHADWDEWLRQAGIAASALSRGPVFNRASMVIDAAVDGQGVALARTALASWDILKGRLACPFSITSPLSKTYWIVCPKAAANRPKVSKFRTWLLQAAAADQTRLDEMFPGLVIAE